MTAYYSNLNNIRKDIITISDADMNALSDVMSDEEKYIDANDTKLISKDYKWSLRSPKLHKAESSYTTDSEAEFVGQTPSHPRDRLRRRTKNFKKYNADADDELEFIGQQPVHPSDRLKRYNEKKRKETDELEFLKQVPAHPRDRHNRYGGNFLPDITPERNTNEIIESSADTKTEVVLPTSHSLNFRKNKKSTPKPKFKYSKVRSTVVLPTSHSLNLSRSQYDRINTLLPTKNYKSTSRFMKKRPTEGISKAKQLISKIKKERRLVDKVNT